MGNEEAVFFSRVLTELTLSFHIIYATIGVGIPLMIMIAQWVGIKKQDEHYILLARRWTRGFVITVAVGRCDRDRDWVTALTPMAQFYAVSGKCHCPAVIYGDICVFL